MLPAICRRATWPQRYGYFSRSPAAVILPEAVPVENRALSLITGTLTTGHSAPPNLVIVSFPPVGSEADLTRCASCEWRVDP
jgi:hypothetical protein